MEGSKNVSEISKTLDQDEKAVTYNLKRLEHCAILSSEVSGKEKVYSLNMEIVAPLSELLTFHTSKYCPKLKTCIPPEKLKEYMKNEAAKETFIEHS
jgi:predicted transcriptional regulator